MVIRLAGQVRRKGYRRNADKVLVRKPEGNRTLQKIRSRLKNKILL
jgi:hypothetical protein